MLVRCLRTAVKAASGRYVIASVDIHNAALSVLSGMIRVKLQRGAAVQVQGVPRKAREQVEARLERRNQIGCRSGARKDVAVVGRVELAARKPEKVAHTQADRLELRARPLRNGLAGVGRLSRQGRGLRPARRSRHGQQWFGDLSAGAE